MLTPEERAAINRENAQKSTGPKTEEGKNKSRRNSMIHGLTATVLTLVSEDPEVIDAEATGWFEAMEPEGLEEETLVGMVAHDAIKLKHAALAETAILNDQISSAISNWDKARENAFLKAKEGFRKNPAKALVELKRNGLGLAWLIDQWKILHVAFEKYGYWNNLELIKDALRLSGFRPDMLSYEDYHAYGLATRAIHCYPKLEKAPNYLEYLNNNKNAQYAGVNGDKMPDDREQCVAQVRHWIATELENLVTFQQHYEAEEQRSRMESETRAMALEATASNRLLVRYTKSIESSLHRTLKRLEKLKSERQKEARKASAPEKRNEAKSKSGNAANPSDVGSCIKLNGKLHEVVEGENGVITMVERRSTPSDSLMHQEMPDREAFSAALLSA